MSKNTVDFIDEAHTLAADFGDQAVQTLADALNSPAGKDTKVVVDGYPSNLKKINPNL